MRLIDADDFKKFLQALCNAGAPYEGVIQLMENQPTAYNVEKVLADLEEFFEDYKYEPNSGLIEIAIDIVRNGGKE